MWRGRRLVIFAMGVVFVVCAARLGPGILSLGEGSNPFGAAGRFFGAALAPALADQSTTLPEDATPFLVRLGHELLRTVRYAFIAMSLAVPVALVLGFLASSAWWSGGLDADARRRRPLVGGVLGLLRWLCRAGLTFMRSIHELIWAIFFLAALGDAPVTACAALALPFAGTLGKVFSELIDEQGGEARDVLLASGASPLRAFFAAVFPQALPHLLTYSLYRFECALRSSAVLGFIGIETIGLGIRRSFENLHFREVWTQLYVLMAVVVLVDALGARLRSRLRAGVGRTRAPDTSGAPGAAAEKAIRRTAPRDRWLRGGLVAVLFLIAVSWVAGPRLSGDLDPARRGERLARFVTKLTPEPVRPANRLAGAGERWEAIRDHAGEAGAWAVRLWRSPGAGALANTVAIATAAAILAGFGAILLLPFGTRALAAHAPYGLVAASSRAGVTVWRVTGATTRGLFILLRAVPEYIYAYLLVGLLGPGAWPLVIALALHNCGILGRLWGEVLENEPSDAPAQAMRGGAGRINTYLGALLPLCFNRFLLFFFYRWETCVREATILGMLGISSLGYHISISRNYLQYDRMLFFVLLGAAVIFAGDFLSDWLRRRLRLGVVR